LLIFIWTSWVTLSTCNIDFGKFHFPIGSNILFQEKVPGQNSFTVLQGQGYHYGANLFTAQFSSLSSIPMWLTERYLPFALGWTPFVFFYFIARIFNDKHALKIALLTFFGINIRAWFIIFLHLLRFFSPDFFQDNNHLELIRLITRDHDLHPSIFFAPQDFLLLPGSYLGGPILYFILFLWIENKILKPYILLLSSLLTCTLALFREDYVVFLFISLTIFTIVYKKIPLKKLFITFLISLSIIIVQGGVISEAIFSNFESEKKIDMEKNQFKAGNFTKLNFSPMPTIATLSIDKARVKVPIFHPQVIMDTFLDLPLLFICFLIFLKLNQKRRMWLCLMTPVFIFLPLILFTDNISMTYKMDLQRIIPYQIIVLSIVLLCKNNIFNKTIVGILIFTGVLSGIIFPQKNQSSFKWYNSDDLAIGNFIQRKTSASHKHIVKTAGINSGYTGLQGFVFKEDFNILRDNYQNQKIKKMYEKGDLEGMQKEGIYYVVYELDKSLENMSFLQEKFGTKLLITLKEP
jgi:hypothetical protein